MQVASPQPPCPLPTPSLVASLAHLQPRHPSGKCWHSELQLKLQLQRATLLQGDFQASSARWHSPRGARLQGSPSGRTLLMSPAMVAAAAIAGEVVDVRDVASED